MEDKRSALIGYIEAKRDELIALARSLSPTELALPTENEGWSVHDTLAHMASSDKDLIDTARRIAGGQAKVSASFNRDAHIQEEVEKRRGRSVDQLLAELAASREEALRVFAEFTDDQLAIDGNLGSGAPINVFGVFHRMGDHDVKHCEEIRKAIGR